MAEEIKIDSRQQTADGRKYPEPTAGAIIYNEKGEILLIKNAKWGDYWAIPGGHIEIGETAEGALKREIKEETGLEIDNIEFVDWQNAIAPNKDYYKKKHFIFLDFCARLAGGEITKSEEMTEYVWVEPKEALKTLKINEHTVLLIEQYLERLKKDSYENLYKRALADYQNLLKQTAKEKMEFAVFANELMLKEILPVYGNLKMAIEHHNNESADEWLTGIKHVVKQFKDALEKIGVAEIKTSGEKFDHNTMEAVSNQETEDEKSDGKVAKQLKAGYKLNGKVIEAAKVIVYKVKSL